MRLSVVAVTAVLAVTLGACTNDPDPEPTPTPTATETATPTPTDSAGPQSSADLELAPGSLGPARVGMTRTEAEATGLFDFDVDLGGCVVPIQWKEQFAGADVLVDQAGTIISLGATSADGPRTADDVGIGSTFGRLIEVYGGNLTAPEIAGYQQVAVYVQDGDNWLGFLFGDAESIEQLDNDPAMEVTFVETTTGDKPGLMRDGC